MKVLEIKMKATKNKRCENCGSNEKIYFIKEKNNFMKPKITKGYLCKKCWLLTTKIAYEDCYKEILL